VRKGLEGKEIEEVELMKGFKRGALLGWGAGETMGRRVFTSDDRMDCRSCQYLCQLFGSYGLGTKRVCGRPRLPMTPATG